MSAYQEGDADVRTGRHCIGQYSHIRELYDSLDKFLHPKEPLASTVVNQTSRRPPNSRRIWLMLILEWGTGGGEGRKIDHFIHEENLGVLTPDDISEAMVEDDGI